MIWYNDKKGNPTLLSPTDYGWDLEDVCYVPVISTLPPPSDAVVEHVRCGCGQRKCFTQKFSYRKNKLKCTEMCDCKVNEGSCKNKAQDKEVRDDETKEDENESGSSKKLNLN